MFKNLWIEFDEDQWQIMHNEAENFSKHQQILQFF